MARHSKNTGNQHRNDIEESAQTVMEGFQDAGRAVRRMANDGLAAARETANDYLEQGRTTVRDAGETVQRHVQDEPMKSVLIAAAAGFLFGIFWTRR